MSKENEPAKPPARPPAKPPSKPPAKADNPPTKKLPKKGSVADLAVKAEREVEQKVKNGQVDLTWQNPADKCSRKRTKSVSPKRKESALRTKQMTTQKKEKLPGKMVYDVSSKENLPATKIDGMPSKAKIPVTKTTDTPSEKTDTSTNIKKTSSKEKVPSANVTDRKSKEKQPAKDAFSTVKESTQESTATAGVNSDINISLDSTLNRPLTLTRQRYPRMALTPSPMGPLLMATLLEMLFPGPDSQPNPNSHPTIPPGFVPRLRMPPRPFLEPISPGEMSFASSPPTNYLILRGNEGSPENDPALLNILSQVAMRGRPSVQPPSSLESISSSRQTAPTGVPRVRPRLPCGTGRRECGPRATTTGPTLTWNSDRPRSKASQEIPASLQIQPNGIPTLDGTEGRLLMIIGSDGPDATEPQSNRGNILDLLSPMSQSGNQVHVFSSPPPQPVPQRGHCRGRGRRGRRRGRGHGRPLPPESNIQYTDIWPASVESPPVPLVDKVPKAAQEVEREASQNNMDNESESARESRRVRRSSMRDIFYQQERMIELLQQILSVLSNNPPHSLRGRHQDRRGRGPRIGNQSPPTVSPSDTSPPAGTSPATGHEADQSITDPSERDQVDDNSPPREPEKKSAAKS